MINRELFFLVIYVINIFFTESYLDFEHSVISNLPELITGLELCKEIICDDTKTVDEQNKAWSRVAEIVEIFANAAKIGKFL